ncbi:MULTISPECIES: precorrin-3B synthase [unclassified Thioalkalivibrio]|uniref:precorrin-3B synthase n=1 Tax=unclassified Thioalkalivibrio TaxID=2621013 RepID=UPI00035D4A12|nr:MULTISPECIES: precorrin-3B synthase [unclassified Thioalkalivibrio]
MNRPAAPQPPRVRGACPGVAAPMATGDGYLLRLRHPIGGLGAAAARVLADTARRLGNGELELTLRGNLQLRGVAAGDLDAARAALAPTGLVDAQAEREARRNVLAAPVPDLDPEAVDVLALARAVSAAIVDAPALRGLPAKVGVVVDGGGRASLRGVPADLRLDPLAGAGPRFRLAAGGTAATATPLGEVSAQHAPAAVVRTLCAFLEQRAVLDPPPGRLRDAVGMPGSEALRLPGAERETPGAVANADTPVRVGGWLGAAAGGAWVGAVFPFGVIDADRLQRLAAWLEPHGGGLRLTPWRALLATGVAAEAAPELQRLLRELGAVTERADRRLAADACVGRPGCASAHIAARSEAAALVQRMPTLAASGVRLQVSACDKRCAAPPRTDGGVVEWIARPDGHAVVLRSRPGAALEWSGLAPAQARVRIAALERAFARQRNAGEELQTMLERIGPEAWNAAVDAALCEEDERDGD